MPHGRSYPHLLNPNFPYLPSSNTARNHRSSFGSANQQLPTPDSPGHPLPFARTYGSGRYSTGGHHSPLVPSPGLSQSIPLPYTPQSHQPSSTEGFYHVMIDALRTYIYQARPYYERLDQRQRTLPWAAPDVQRFLAIIKCDAPAVWRFTSEGDLDHLWRSIHQRCCEAIRQVPPADQLHGYWMVILEWYLNHGPTRPVAPAPGPGTDKGPSPDTQLWIQELEKVFQAGLETEARGWRAILPPPPVTSSTTAVSAAPSTTGSSSPLLAPAPTAPTTTASGAHSGIFPPYALLAVDHHRNLYPSTSNSAVLSPSPVPQLVVGLQSSPSLLTKTSRGSSKRGSSQMESEEPSVSASPVDLAISRFQDALLADGGMLNDVAARPSQVSVDPGTVPTPTTITITTTTAAAAVATTTTVPLGGGRERAVSALSSLPNGTTGLKKYKFVGGVSNPRRPNRNHSGPGVNKKSTTQSMIAAHNNNNQQPQQQQDPSNQPTNSARAASLGSHHPSVLAPLPARTDSTRTGSATAPGGGEGEDLPKGSTKGRPRKNRRSELTLASTVPTSLGEGASGPMPPAGSLNSPRTPQTESSTYRTAPPTMSPPTAGWSDTMASSPQPRRLSASGSLDFRSGTEPVRPTPVSSASSFDPYASAYPYPHSYHPSPPATSSLAHRSALVHSLQALQTKLATVCHGWQSQPHIEQPEFKRDLHTIYSEMMNVNQLIVNQLVLENGEVEDKKNPE
ncbi:hypothetical protein H4R33_000900 [Dimargaris cristalligena]|nr:hypothetical protein H4R33_000900 [Dimargaris cristalligena]